MPAMTRTVARQGDGDVPHDATAVATALGRETLDEPPAPVSAVGDAVVQAVLAALPELEGVGVHQIAAPERGQRNLLAESSGHLPVPSIEDIPPADHPALGRR